MTPDHSTSFETGFHFSLASALVIGLPEEPHSGDAPLMMEPIGDCEAHHMITDLGEPFTVVFFEEQLWAHALCSRLRELGVNAAMGYDANYGGWQPGNRLVKPEYVVVFSGKVGDMLRKVGDAAFEAAELTLTVGETSALASALTSGIGPDGRFIDDWDTPSSELYTSSRLNALAIYNVFTRAGYDVHHESYESELTDGYVYIENRLATNCPVNHLREVDASLS